MTLKKIDQSELKLNEKTCLYRAIPQGVAEFNIIYVSKKIDKKCYMSRIGETYFTPSFFEALAYGRDWGFKLDSQNITFPFTDYMTLLEINAKPYLNKLYEDTSGNEGIVIKGPIELSDITVLFSADKNCLDDLDLDDVELHNSYENKQASYEMRKNDLLFAVGDPEDISLSGHYRKDSELVITKIFQHFKTWPAHLHPNPSKEEIAKLLPEIISLFGPTEKTQ